MFLSLVTHVFFMFFPQVYTACSMTRNALVLNSSPPMQKTNNAWRRLGLNSTDKDGWFHKQCVHGISILCFLGILGDYKTITINTHKRAMASSVIQVCLVDGRGVQLDVANHRTFADVKTAMSSKFGISYAYIMYRSPANDVVSDTDLVKKVITTHKEFNTCLDYYAHVQNYILIGMSDGTSLPKVEFDFYRIESVNHLRRAIREKFDWRESIHFDVAFWDTLI